MLEEMKAYKYSIDNKFGLFQKIQTKAKNDKTYFTSIRQIFDEKWIKGVSIGEFSIFLFEVPIKTIISQSSKMLGNKCKFRFLPEDFGSFLALTIAMSKRLNKLFRHELNLRFANENNLLYF